MDRKSGASLEAPLSARIGNLGRQRTRGTSSHQDQLYQAVTKEISNRRKRLSPETMEAFNAFSASVFADGALSAKTIDLCAGNNPVLSGRQLTADSRQPKIGVR
jgi:hypothetical protein